MLLDRSDAFARLAAEYAGKQRSSRAAAEDDWLSHMPASLQQRFANVAALNHDLMAGVMTGQHRCDIALYKDAAMAFPLEKLKAYGFWRDTVLLPLASEIVKFPDQADELRKAFHAISNQPGAFEPQGGYPQTKNDSLLDAAIRDASRRIAAGEPVRNMASFIDEAKAHGWQPPAKMTDVAIYQTQASAPPPLDMSRFAWDAVNAMPPYKRAPQIDCVMYAGEPGVISGSGGSAKTTWAVVLALSAATGRDLFGLGRVKREKVLFIVAEDSLQEVRLRFKAAMMHYGIADHDLAGWLWVVGCEDSGNLVVTTTMPGGREVFRPEGVLHFLKMLQATGAKVAFIDPLVSVLGNGLNDNGLVSNVYTGWKDAIGSVGASLTLVNHTKKGARASTAGADANLGAAAIVNRARVGFGIEAVSEAEALKLGADPGNARGIKQIVHTKANLSRLMEDMYIEVIGVPMGNGTPDYPEEDVIPVATRFYPQIGGGGTWCTDPMRQAALAAIAQGTPQGAPMSLKSGQNSPRWYGHFLPAALAPFLPNKTPAELEACTKAIVADLRIKGWLNEVETSVSRPGKGKVVQKGMEAVWSATPWAGHPVPGPHCS